MFRDSFSNQPLMPSEREQSQNQQTRKRQFSDHCSNLSVEEKEIMQSQGKKYKIRSTHTAIFNKILSKVPGYSQNLNKLQAASISSKSDINSTEYQQKLNSSQISNVQQQSQTEQPNPSVIFIPFSQTQDQLRMNQQLQQHIAKLYTPLLYCQILPWMNANIKQIKEPQIRLHEQIRTFYYYLKPSKEEHQIRTNIFEHVKSVIAELYPNSQVIAFGSFATKFYLPDGDIDIAALINPYDSDRQKTSEYYKKIFQQFKDKHRKRYRSIKYISKAKTPLVKMKDQQTNLSIDITINKLAGVEQIKNFIKMRIAYPEFKYLIFVLKVMLKIRNLSETFSGGVGSFLLVCMLFHFLRNFHEIYQPSETHMYSLGIYLVKFFSFYYMNVDYYKQVISVKTGRITRRKRRPNTLSMLSPFDDTTDIGIKAKKMNQVLDVFKNRAKVIKEKHFEQGESILKEIINPSMNQFIYYNLKKQFTSNLQDLKYQEEAEVDEQQALRTQILKQQQEIEIQKNFAKKAYCQHKCEKQQDGDINNQQKNDSSSISY